MPDCTQKGCTKPAKITIEYENPDEEVAYCWMCGLSHFQMDPRSVAARKGVAQGAAAGGDDDDDD